MNRSFRYEYSQVQPQKRHNPSQKLPGFALANVSLNPYQKDGRVPLEGRVTYE